MAASRAPGAEGFNHFGRIDTWVNNAGITIGGTVDATAYDEIERLVRVNLLSQIYGVKAALPYMKRQGIGAFICLGSVAGVRSFPLQTVYCATKHGVKALCEGLRLELQREPGEYHVTMIAPPSINTPLFEQARSKLGNKLAPPPPVYDPKIVAESIVFAAEHPRRDIFIGEAKLFDIMERISPAFTDWYMTLGGRIFRQQVSEKANGHSDNLFQPPPGRRSVRGSYSRMVRPTSPYTRTFEWHPLLKTIGLGVAIVGAAALMRGFARVPRTPVRRLRDTATESIKAIW